MKKIITSVVALGLGATLFTGCATHPTAGALFSDIKAPVTATSNVRATRVGVSESCVSILGLVATGDCSVANAKKNGGITQVSTVDYQTNNILGIINKGKTIITGE
jgi:hypothetical protein